MTKEEFYVLNNLYDASIGRAQSTKDIFLNHVFQHKDVFARLVAQGLIHERSGEITPDGLSALEPYRVKNAIILAAGSATRFIPLSLEQPKALYEVRGEKLIERQIQQLHEAGIKDISVVIGYKKNMFEYLREKYNVTLVFNPLYNVKNNIESLRIARGKISNSYICVCDCYFVENPFHQYEYCSFYAGYFSNKQEDEFYARIDEDSRIVFMDKGNNIGCMLLGHSFWTKDFSESFFNLVEMDQSRGEYDNKFWEWLVKDNLEKLPALYYKEYALGDIFEFDYFEQLRQFDTSYISHAQSDILRNIKLVFRCDEEDIVDFRTVSEGLTNTSFVFKIEGKDYIYRHPGDGTERIINRRNEKRSLIIAKEYNVDPTYIYMDIIEGWKISRFVGEFREPDYNSAEDSTKIISVLRKLHSIPIKVEYGLNPWEDALEIERFLKEKDPYCFEEHEGLKNSIFRIYQRTKGDGISKCFCHGDTYKHNWMIKPDGEVYLIDWEYSGYSDPGIDVGYYIVDAMYGFEEAKKFIREYLGKGWSKKREFHYMAYTALIAYYWFVWAKYRETCGANMGDSLTDWHAMAIKYAEFLEAK